MNSAQSLRKPIAFSVVVHVMLVAVVWFLPRNADLTEKVETVSMDIFENIKDQAPLKQLTQKIKTKVFKKEPSISKLETVASALNSESINKDLKSLYSSESGSVSASLVDGAQVTTRAKLLSDHKVTYPEEAKENSVEGPVVMDLVIDSNGKVVDAKLIKGPGHGLNEAALAATSKFVFSPAMMGDKAVSVRIRYTYRFVLDTR